MVSCESNFIAPEKISIALSGTRLENIQQQCYHVANFYTKANLLRQLLEDKKEFRKVLVFVTGKKNVELLYAALEETYASEMGFIHTDRSQNNRIAAIRLFDNGMHRILITTKTNQQKQNCNRNVPTTEKQAAEHKRNCKDKRPARTS